jgi:Fis family transcriptional regulator
VNTTNESGSLREQMNVFVIHLLESGISLEEGEQEFRKLYLTQALAVNKGNQCKAARQAGIHRNTLTRSAAELKIDLRAIRNVANGRRPQRSGMNRLAKAG